MRYLSSYGLIFLPSLSASYRDYCLESSMAKASLAQCFIPPRVYIISNWYLHPAIAQALGREITMTAWTRVWRQSCATWGLAWLPLTGALKPLLEPLLWEAFVIPIYRNATAHYMPLVMVKYWSNLLVAMLMLEKFGASLPQEEKKSR